MSVANNKRNESLLPAIPHENELREIIAEIQAMTPEELLEASVEAGIHNPDGSLTQAYTDTSNAPVR